ncbi:MAG: PIN domain-containing protein [Halobacteriales archaeon]
MILDTTFLVDLLRGEDAVEEVVERANSEAVFVTPISVMELYEGASLAADADEKHHVESLLDGLKEMGFDVPAAKRAGEINARLQERGQPIDAEDVMIAAVALENDQAVMTRNLDDFDKIDNLETVAY